MKQKIRLLCVRKFVSPKLLNLYSLCNLWDWSLLGICSSLVTGVSTVSFEIIISQIYGHFKGLVCNWVWFVTNKLLGYSLDSDFNCMLLHLRDKDMALAATVVCLQVTFTLRHLITLPACSGSVFVPHVIFHSMALTKLINICYRPFR